jgi:hypothetical protein
MTMLLWRKTILHGRCMAVGRLPDKSASSARPRVALMQIRRGPISTKGCRAAPPALSSKA